ncbi:MAG TPA: lysylphosphatidylglycerol synthase transmembrane domain-containing protein [Bryobacteraceae bacterium]|nr:lysylphosphatidylglycerol synthase transmembrane domain-containing protein [Bryobacteraceae bacterium]HOQ45955.1 lysylphosphatidylglycerol synthase transmembrane domain-containing protein [Bryobacteraceae bacterium]HPQ16717.1 lysylphosphatidylglycerol synthase transmembrane domain-containing protein [Bryobacteraceae bacterium]HPU73226.1 lysylphosphatidylglycerol synthase transmembrane domain-containing protein [Bryobacteraceae bacterium]
MQGSILARSGKNGGENRLDGEKLPGQRGAVRWRMILLLAAGAALLIWLLRERWQEAQFQWGEFTRSFLLVNWKWILAGWAVGVLTYYGRALRWAVMLRPLRAQPSIWRLFKATTIGFTAVVLLGRPGEFVRPYLISLRERVPFSSQLAAWFLERICDLLAVLLIFGFTLSQLGGAGAKVGPKLHWVLEVGGYLLGFMGLVCLVVLFLLARYSETMRRRLAEALVFLPERYQQRIQRVVDAFLEGSAAVKSQNSARWIFLYTVLEWLVIVVCFVCIFKAYAATSSFALRDVLIVMGFVAFGSIVQIPGVGGGVQIVMIVVLTELYGLGVELATSISLLTWAVTFVGIVPIGLLFAFHEGLNWKRLRQLEVDAVASARAHSEDTEKTGEKT